VKAGFRTIPCLVRDPIENHAGAAKARHMQILGEAPPTCPP